MKGGDDVGVWNFYHSHNNQSKVVIFESTIKIFEPTIKIFELDSECCLEEERSTVVKHIQPIITKKVERHYYHHYYVYEPVECHEIRRYHHGMNCNFNDHSHYSYDYDPELNRY